MKTKTISEAFESLKQIDGEVWMDVPGFPGYQASDQGRIRSLDRKVYHKSGFFTRRAGKILTPTTGKDGKYNRVMMSGKFKSIHRIVALTFLGLPDEMQVNHINGIKTDNRVSNLEVVTAQQNIDHAWATGLTDVRGEKNGSAKLTKRDVNHIRNCRSIWTQQELADYYGVTKTQISSIQKYKSWNHV